MDKKIHVSFITVKMKQFKLLRLRPNLKIKIRKRRRLKEVISLLTVPPSK